MSDIEIITASSAPAQQSGSNPIEGVVLDEVTEEKEELETMEVEVQEAQFLSDSVRVILTGGIEKYVSYQSFLSVLSASIGQIEDKSLDGFLLPANCFYFAKSSQELQVSCYYPSCPQKLMYYDRKMDILTPNIIVSHVLKKDVKDKAWKLTGSKYFCTDLDIGMLPKDFIFSVNRDKRIWLLPMSNTYAEGNMCYGSNQMTRQFVDNNLRGLNWYYQYMWESPFNDDLGINSAEGYSVSNWYKLLSDTLKDKKPFPYDQLRGYRSR